MKVRRLHAVLVVALMLAFATCAQAAPAETTAKKVHDNDSGQTKAQALVDKALTAEAAGDAQARADFLAQALDADPDNAQAHWQLGEIKIDGRWLSSDSAAATSAMSAKLQQYQQRRFKGRNTADEHMKLAAWCEEEGLQDQAKMHWQAALRLRPSHAQQREIIGKLGLVRVRKQLLPAEQAAAIKKHDKELEAVMHKWKPILTRLRGDLESRDASRKIAAAQQLKDIQDIAVIPVIETVFAKAPASSGTAAVAGLAAMPQLKASESLVRFAVEAENEEVRKAAAEALKSRDIFSYVPMLLAGLGNPIEINFQTFAGEGGVFGERLTLFREGQDQNYSYTSGLTALPNFTPQAGAVMVPQTAAAERNVAHQAAADRATALAAAAENERTAIVNQRIVAALQIATGNEGIGDDAKQWWSWWDEYNDSHYATDRQTYEVNRASYTYYGATAYYPTPASQSYQQTYTPSDSKHTPTYTAPQLPEASKNMHYLGLNPRFHYDSGKIACFVPGTIVWTVTGKMPIEDVHMGDLVLAQNVETGELAYKPVMKVTKGPPLPLVEIRTGEETIRCTHGHLFWVSGQGWRMAKELKVGDRLHTAKGTVTIDSVAKNGEESCHNLVVPQFNTYFVTDQQILVHDIDIREPTLAKVPGQVVE